MPPKRDLEVGRTIPQSGVWPVDSQTAVPVEEGHLWMDGCFDFFHHGHAGAMLQARRLGEALFVGLHSDKEIADNKGPTVMSITERAAAVNACRFSTLCILHAPYVTSLPWISRYGCKYVVHGDDVTSDAGGNDRYHFIKKVGRMKIVKRIPGISTTDLVGRMLLCTKTHFIKNLPDVMAGKEGRGSEDERKAYGKEVETMIEEYAAAANGREPFVQVWSFHPKHRSIERHQSRIKGDPGEAGSGSIPRNHDCGEGTFASMVDGFGPRVGQRTIYVDGGFDLFSSGHIAFLETIAELEDNLGHERGWFSPAGTSKRIEETGSDYGPAYIIAGIHDDEVINYYKGINFPIMNIFERGLCVVQCKYVHSVVFGAPFVPTKTFLTGLLAMSATDKSHPDVVYHGPTSYMPALTDSYADARALSIFSETPAHNFQDVNAAHIVKRIMDNRAQYEDRQRKKGVIGVGEEATKKREQMVKEAADRLNKMKEEARKDLQRRHSEVERQFGV